MRFPTNFTLLFSMVITLLVSSSPTIGQDLQLGGISVTRFPSAKVKDSPLNREIEVNEYNFFLNVPKKLKNEKTILINGLQYRLVTSFADNDIMLGIDGQNLHLVGYRLTILHKLKHDWAALLNVNPVLSSTFNTQIEGDDFLFNGSLLFVKKKSDRFSYGGGVVFTSRFGDPILLPILQLTFTSQKGKFQVLLPRRITYDHYYKRFTIGLKAEVDGSLYNVNYSRTSPLDELQPVNKIAYTRVVFGPNISYRVGKVIQLKASGGITVGQSMELQSELFEDEKYQVDNGSFLQFGISIVPPKKTNDL
ncbi:DUF6268 family outer membrane beta-barrel protein [Ekhidna sp.]